uniref:Impact-like protein n=1 Tax=Nannochloropsis gaditana (strain CCMP526) TaxID=1093141 RepID=I2CS51_NANGC
MYAFRVFDVKKQAQVNDNDDDGENAAGGKLAELLAVMGVNNVIVVVSRWWGGLLLGPSRFRVINNTARQLLEQCGVRGRSGEKEGGGAGGKGLSASGKR